MGIIKEGLAEYQLLEDFSEYILLNGLKGSFIPSTSSYISMAPIRCRMAPFWISPFLIGSPALFQLLSNSQ